MDMQLTIALGQGSINVFLQQGFFPDQTIFNDLHKHWYPEIHWVMQGHADFQIDQKRYTFHAGDLFVVPKKTFHTCLCFSEDIQHTAFQADICAPEFAQHFLPPSPLKELFYDNDMEALLVEGKSSRIPVLLSLLCSVFSNGVNVLPAPVQDAAYIIEDFFSRRYGEDITLAHLAQDLQLSEKQAQRLVQKHTGRTFRKELTARRMEVATHLLDTGILSLSEIAEYVGYHSYSGFWKAYSKSGSVNE